MSPAVVVAPRTAAGLLHAAAAVAHHPHSVQQRRAASFGTPCITSTVTAAAAAAVVAAVPQHAFFGAAEPTAYAMRRRSQQHQQQRQQQRRLQFPRRAVAARSKDQTSSGNDSSSGHKLNNTATSSSAPVVPTEKPPPATAAAPPQLPSYTHLIISPQQQQPGAANPDADTRMSELADGDECLLAIAPGALIPPPAFKPLAEAVQQAAAPNLRLWVGVLNIDYPSLMTTLCGPNATIPDTLAAMQQYDVYGKLLEQVVEQAAAAGFVPIRNGFQARVSNMVMVCHSASCLGFAAAAARGAAATIMLAGVPNAPGDLPLDVFSLEAWPRPLMLLVGELDGQMRWPLLSSYIAESAAMAAKFGPEYSCLYKPVVVVRGLNHGNTSSGEPRVQRGDITAAVDPYDKCIKTLGGLIASFTTAHLAIAPKPAKRQASQNLIDAVHRSMELTSPYCIARGLGDPAAPFAAATATTSTTASSSTALGAIPPGASQTAAAAGGGLLLAALPPRVPGQEKVRSLPPGEVVAAEAQAVAAQLLILSGLPADQLPRLHVVATAHTEVETFLYSQPVMVPLDVPADGGEGGGGGKWLLHVHVMLHFRALDAPGLYLVPRAPDLWLKLKCAHFVAALLGLPDPAQYVTPPPADINRAVLQAALQAAPPRVVERYRDLGRQLDFGHDLDVLAPADPEGQQPRTPTTPEEFVRHSRITFTYPLPLLDQDPAAGNPAANAASSTQQPNDGSPVGGGLCRPPVSVRVSSPYLLMPPPADVASRRVAETRFMGPFYAKVLSVAQALEWVYLDCMRDVETPW